MIRNVTFSGAMEQWGFRSFGLERQVELSARNDTLNRGNKEYLCSQQKQTDATPAGQLKAC